MGAQISSSSKLNENELLRRFSGLEPLTDNDPFWNQLLSFNFRPPSNRIDGKFFEETINDLLEALMYNTSTTGNFASMVRVFLRRANELKASAQCEDKLFLWHTSNALLILRFACKFMAQRLNPEEFCRSFVKNENSLNNNNNNVTTTTNTEEDKININTTTTTTTNLQNEAAVDEFLGALVEILVDLPINDLTFRAHYEALNCLMAVLSCELFGRNSKPSKFLNILMHGKCAIHAPFLTKVLLHNYVYHDGQTLDQLKGYYDGGGSLILGLAASFANVLQWGYGSGGEGSMSDFKPAETLSTQSLYALLILSCHHGIGPVQNEKQQNASILLNPYREALFAFHNSQEVSTLSSPTLSVATFKFDYSLLYEKLCTKADQEPSLLLLYLLVHRNPGFRNFVLSRVNMENLVFPLLKVLHQHNNADSKGKQLNDNDLGLDIITSPDDKEERERIVTSCDSHKVYLALILLLMFSEDDFFCKVIHETIVKDLKWFSKSRSFNELSLGGLIILILLKTIQHNVARVKDRYLQTNCLATLANMSANFKQLHPYVCQQLIGCMEQLCKRHARLIETIGFVNANEFDAKDAANNENLQTITALEEAMRMLMEILNSCLTNSLRNNPHLIYTMLYERHLFDNLQNHPMFQDLSWNIGSVLNHFSTRVSALDKGANVNEVLAVIQQGALQWPTDRLKRFPELKFKYVEDANTEDFFVPYVWSLLFKFSGFYWEASKIRLFEARIIKRIDNK